MKGLLCFITGAAIGSVVTWKIVEKKYKELADEEIASVVETFKNKNKKKKTKEEVKEAVTNILDNSTEKMESIIEKNDYTAKVEKHVIPYVIKPEEYGENNEYGTKSLTYYADEILADEMDEPITEDIELMLGPNALSHFGEYEDDSVYIRDEEKGIDYEILKSEKCFSEIPVRGRVN